MKALMTLIAMSLLTTIAQAGPSVSGGTGPLGTVNCQSDDQSYAVEIHHSAAVGLWTGKLNVQGEEKRIFCKANIESLDVLSCQESGNARGLFLVDITIAEETIATVKIRQMFPLKSKILSSMQCDSNL